MSHKFKICPVCFGEGSVCRIKEAFTREEAEEWYGPEVDEFLEEYLTRGGAYDEVCPACKGHRVLSAQQFTDWEDEREYQAERNAEIRAGC